MTSGPRPIEARGGLPVRVAVVGHRKLQNETALARQVRHAFDVIVERFSGDGSNPIRLIVLSALAEGADRLVWKEAVARGLRRVNRTTAFAKTATPTP